MALVKAVDGLGAFSFAGMEYVPDERGILEIPDQATAAALIHGYVSASAADLTPVPTEGEAVASQQGLAIAAMRRSELLAYCSKNDLPVPDGASVSVLRALVLAHFTDLEQALHAEENVLLNPSDPPAAGAADVQPLETPTV